MHSVRQGITYALPRFTMRIALAVTAIVAIFAWQGGIVWQRKAAMRDSPRTFLLDAFIPGEPNTERHRVNFLRALMGDEPVHLIYQVPDNDWEVEQIRLQGLFPKATIEVMHPLLETPFPN